MILLLAASLRICGLSQESLWLDEGFTSRRAGNSFRELASEFHNQTQSGLYYVGIKLWSMLFGTSEFSLRLPSALAGIATVLVIFLLARRLFSQKVALWSAGLLAVNPFAIYYSQEARPYALLLLAVTLSVNFLLRMRRDYTRPAIFGFLVTTLIALYSHPLAPLVLGFEAFAVFLYWRSGGEAAPLTPVRKPLAWIGIAALLYLPQVLFMWHTMAGKIQGHGSAGWITVPDARILYQTARQYFMASDLAGLAMLIFLGAFAFKPRWDRQSGRGILLMLALIATCVGAPWILSQIVTPVYVIRYTIPALIGVMILLAWALDKLPRPLRFLAAVVFLGMTVHALYGYYAGVDKDPYRETAALLRNRVEPGDLVILQASYSRDAFSYYFHAPDGVHVIAPRPHDAIPSEIAAANRIFVVRSYGLQSQSRTDSLLAYIGQNRRAGEPIAVHGWADRNPGTYWIADIDVIPFYSSVHDPHNGSRP